MSLTGISGTAAGNSYSIVLPQHSAVCRFCNTPARRREVFEIISKEFFHRACINSPPSAAEHNETRNPVSTHLFVDDYFRFTCAAHYFSAGAAVRSIV